MPVICAGQARCDIIDAWLIPPPAVKVMSASRWRGVSIVSPAGAKLSTLRREVVVLPPKPVGALVSTDTGVLRVGVGAAAARLLSTSTLVTGAGAAGGGGGGVVEYGVGGGRGFCPRFGATAGAPGVLRSSSMGESRPVPLPGCPLASPSSSFGPLASLVALAGDLPRPAGSK